jgi:hypothetical protein
MSERQQHLGLIVKSAFFSLIIFTGFSFGQSDWDSISLLPSTELTSVTYGNNRFVAVGLNKLVRISLDGATWTAESSGTAQDLYSITFGKNQFVAVGNYGAVYTSPDGEAWTAESSGVTQNLLCVTYGNDQFVAVGKRSTLITSSDGITWSKKVLKTTEDLCGVTYGNSKFVAVGTYRMEDYSIIFTSSDGITWTLRSSRTKRDLRSVTYGNNMFVAVGDTIVASTDGISWSTRQSLVPNLLYSVTYGNNQFVAVGAFSIVLASPDGTTWTPKFTNTWLSDLQSIIYVNDLFVAVGWCGAYTILTSKADKQGVIDNNLNNAIIAHGAILVKNDFISILAPFKNQSQQICARIFNFAGMLVYSTETPMENGILYVSTKSLSSGAYIVTMTDSKNVALSLLWKKAKR